MDGESKGHEKLASILLDRNSQPCDLPLELLRKITNYFSDDRLLGEGGFGKVYKGVLQNGAMVAVKKLEQLKPGVQEKQFENEVFHLMGLNHRNIVRVLGYCYETRNECLELNELNRRYGFAEKQQRLLCLEYLSKGSLNEHLSDESCGFDWVTRYKIIEGVCYGIHYLHEECQCQINGSIIHMDLKPANILLDDDMVPKVADFGLSRLFDDKKTQTHATSLAGSLGYMAPEYIYKHQITTKADIYSLGVIIIEIITGGRIDPFNFTNVTSCEDFVETVLQNWRNRSKVAPSETDCKQIKCCLEIGLSCVKVSSNERPKTKEIIERLSRWESTSRYVNNDDRPPTDKIVSDQKELLEITPLELRFCLELNKQIPCLVQLTNNTDRYVAFHFGVLKTTNLYYIEPPSGFLRPRSTSHVTVTMEERSVVLQDWQCYDEFLVQSVIVREDSLMSSEHVTGHMFKKMPGNVVDQVKLTVGYVGSSSGLNDIDCQKEDVEQLINLCQDLGFSSGRPVAACLIYRCLVYWRTFETERTSVSDCIIQKICTAIKAQDNNDMLAYWLSNSSTVLLLLQRTLKTTGAAELTPQRQRSSAASFKRCLPDHLIGGQGDLQQVESKNPVLLFNQKLTNTLENIYGMIRNNLKKEIAPLLSLCIQAPRTSQASHVKGSRLKATLIGHWQSIVKILTNYLVVLKANYVPSFLITKVFMQTFSFFNVQLFNSLLLRRECCSFSNGEYVKAGFAELEQWCTHATEEYVGSSWEELKHIRQAVGFLVFHDKPTKTLKEITNDFCPVLSIQQLYRISTMYWDDKYGTRSVSFEVISSMRVIMTEQSNSALSTSFLLDDDLSIPFSGGDILKTMAEFEVTDVDMPPLIREHSAFAFLDQRKD